MLSYHVLKNHAGILLIGDCTSLRWLHEVVHDVNERSPLVTDKEGMFLGLAYDVRKAYEQQREVLQPPQEHGSGASRARPALSKLLREISAGDTLVVVRLDRLARSVGHLLEVIEDLTAKKAHFRSLHDPIDTATPQGMFSLQVLGAVAQLERALISERTKAGIRAAKAKGRLPGNPGIREKRPEALARMTAAQKAAYGDRIQTTVNQWFPTVRRMRPDHTWDDIARVLKQRGLDWTPERLRRAVKWLVAEHMADPTLLRKSPPRQPEDRLMTLVAGIHSSNPDLTLREIAAQLGGATHEDEDIAPQRPVGRSDAAYSQMIQNSGKRRRQRGRPGADQRCDQQRAEDQKTSKEPPRGLRCPPAFHQ
ncbi:recombinase family protein [Paramesorhizobium deserti]|uniref:recombinase family protein n=1 Tax=Paramesorhizobium deserti TaxID=1494590 RepID=UPI000A5DB5E1|nr:recombinase family protein [Paramesorhizobium deserti]